MREETIPDPLECPDPCAIATELGSQTGDMSIQAPGRDALRVQTDRGQENIAADHCRGAHQECAQDPKLGSGQMNAFLPDEHKFALDIDPQLADADGCFRALMVPSEGSLVRRKGHRGTTGFNDLHSHPAHLSAMQCNTMVTM